MATMVEVFRLVRKVLADDGTLWLNMGDCSATGAGAVGECPGGGEQGNRWAGRPARGATSTAGYRGTRPASAKHDGGTIVGSMVQPNRMPQAGLKPKDLCGVPWRVAFALQADGWWLRSDIIWNKPNPMPESVTDRPTRSHEYLFLLTKRGRYYYDAAAIAEPASPDTHARYARAHTAVEVPGQPPQHGVAGNRPNRNNGQPAGWGRDLDVGPRQRPNGQKPVAGWATEGADHSAIAHAQERVDRGKRKLLKRATPRGANGKSNASFDAAMAVMPLRRNKRTVWTIPSQPYAEAHFATFPEALVEPCILAGSRVGDTVLDPFMGSGTVARVAQRLGRDWRGIELNPRYAEMIDDRTRQQATPLTAPPRASGHPPNQSEEQAQ